MASGGEANRNLFKPGSYGCLWFRSHYRSRLRSWRGRAPPHPHTNTRTRWWEPGERTVGAAHRSTPNRCGGLFTHVRIEIL